MSARERRVDEPQSIAGYRDGVREAGSEATAAAQEADGSADGATAPRSERTERGSAEVLAQVQIHHRAALPFRPLQQCHAL